MHSDTLRVPVISVLGHSMKLLYRIIIVASLATGCTSGRSVDAPLGTIKCKQCGASAPANRWECEVIDDWIETKHATCAGCGTLTRVVIVTPIQAEDITEIKVLNQDGEMPQPSPEPYSE